MSRISNMSATEGNRAIPAGGLPSFPFLKLPLEIRRYVYKYVLVEDKQPLRLARKSKTCERSKNNSIAVLTTSREVNIEAYPVFLSVNTFEISGTHRDWQWLKKLGPDGWKALRKIIFINGSLSYSSTTHRTFNILARCPRLSLTIKIAQNHLMMLNYMDVFRYLHGFYQATCSRATVEESAELQAKYSYWGSDFSVAICSEDSWRELKAKRVQPLLEGIMSPCPKKCKAHKARALSNSMSVVHIICACHCPDCHTYSW